MKHASPGDNPPMPGSERSRPATPRADSLCSRTRSPSFVTTTGLIRQMPVWRIAAAPPPCQVMPKSQGRSQARRTVPHWPGRITCVPSRFWPRFGLPVGL